MHLKTVLFIALLLVDGGSWAAPAKSRPRKLVFPSKAGAITFNHAAHAKRAKRHCNKCHNGLWPKSSKTPVKSSEGCRTCHHAGGEAFEMKGNCDRCHSSKDAAGRPVLR